MNLECTFFLLGRIRVVSIPTHWHFLFPTLLVKYFLFREYLADTLFSKPWRKGYCVNNCFKSKILWTRWITINVGNCMATRWRYSYLLGFLIYNCLIFIEFQMTDYDFHFNLPLFQSVYDTYYESREFSSQL